MISRNSKLDLAAGYLRTAEHVVVFTGAGVSAESGIDTFRDDGGLWQEFPPEQFAHWQGILQTARRNPRRLASFVVHVLKPVAEAKPNAAHLAIAEAEKQTDITVVTQNVDGLHQEAGSTVVREIHGSLLEIVTLRRQFVRLLSRKRLARIVRWLNWAARSWLAVPLIPFALNPLAGLSWRGVVRPSAVLFGEGMMEPDWSDALADSCDCDVMLVIGTSGVVFPAAMLPFEARDNGVHIITIDPEDSGMGELWLQGTACEIVPELMKRAFGASDEAE